MQNRIAKIEGLEGLDRLKNLELAANRIRVGLTLSFPSIATIQLLIAASRWWEYASFSTAG